MTEPLTDPPTRKPRGRPLLTTLPAGTNVFRVHKSHRPAGTFNSTPHPTRLTGGRFDSLDGSYGFLYVADTAAAAIAETLCRDLPLTGSARLLPRVRLAGRVLSQLQLTRDVPVLSLHGPALAHVGAPLALTKCGAEDYESTRAWAVALRRWVPQAEGFEYRPRHDEDALVWVLFESKSGMLRRRGKSVSLESAEGLRIVRDVVHLHNATLA